PSAVVRDRDSFGAERAHALKFRFWSRLDHHHGARHACLSRSISDPLSGVSRANGPDATLVLGLGEHRHSIGRPAQFVSINWLQVLQLEPDVGTIRSEFQAD